MGIIIGKKMYGFKKLLNFLKKSWRFKEFHNRMLPEQFYYYTQRLGKVQGKKIRSKKLINTSKQ
jgi:hypothetical protein